MNACAPDVPPTINSSTVHPVDKSTLDTKSKYFIAFNVAAVDVVVVPKLVGFFIKDICLKSFPTVKSAPDPPEPDNCVLIPTKNPPSSAVGSTPCPLPGAKVTLAAAPEPPPPDITNLAKVYPAPLSVIVIAVTLFVDTVAVAVAPVPSPVIVTVGVPL